jgi:hypothetical protein
VTEEELNVWKNKYKKTKLRCFSPPANYTDRATPLVGEVSANFIFSKVGKVGKINVAAINVHEGE